MISTSTVVTQALQKQFNDTLADIWNGQYRRPEYERLSTGMFRPIEQRQKNATDWLKYISEFNSQFSLFKLTRSFLHYAHFCLKLFISLSTS
jgi:hypothetical protein